MYSYPNAPVLPYLTIAKEKFAKNDDPKQPYIYKYLKKNEEKEISPSKKLLCDRACIRVLFFYGRSSFAVIESSMSTSSQTGFVHKIVHKIRPKKNSPSK
jgi:hypothetical protein